MHSVYHKILYLGTNIENVDILTFTLKSHEILDLREEIWLRSPVCSLIIIGVLPDLFNDLWQIDGFTFKHLRHLRQKSHMALHHRQHGLQEELSVRPQHRPDIRRRIC